MLKTGLYMLSILWIGLFLLQCGNSPNEPAVRDLSVAEKRLVKSDNRFGFKLFQELNQREENKNIFISPLSVSMALGMTLNGANGTTREAMESALEFAGLTTEEINASYQSLIELLTQLDQKVRFQIANSIWYRQGMTFEQAFIQLNKSYFDALVQDLDFDDPGSVDLINAWVNDNTNGKIKEIIDGIDPQMVMFLINAIYFKGTWRYEFDEEMTQDDFFLRQDGSQVASKMMIQTNEFDYLENDEFQAIELPYGNGQFRAAILLPVPGKDIDEFLAEFNQESWDSWLQHFSRDSVTLEFPRFKLEYDVKLNDVLKALGMDVAFSEYEADFTRMYQPGGLFISYVKHRTFVEVNEEGTEAAAVTVVGMQTTSAGPHREIKYMRVDHPFVFVIRENHSRTILFMGKIIEPQFEEQ